MLRDALSSAHAQDQAVRERLQAKADEFETLFDSSPIGMAFAQDRECRIVLHNAAMDRLMGSPQAVADGRPRGPDVADRGPEQDGGEQKRDGEASDVGEAHLTAVSWLTRTR